MRFASKIGLSTAAAALIIGPLLGAALFFKVRSVLQEHITQDQVQSASSVMREIDTAMYRAYLDVSMIAADELLREAVEHPQNPVQEQLEEEMEERERVTGPWKVLMVFDQAGRALLGPKPMGSAKHISAYPASKIGFDQAMKGEIYYSGQLLCPKTNEPIVIFASPVYAGKNKDKVVGVVVAHYTWSAVQNILDYVDPSAKVHLLNQEREVIGSRSNDAHPLLRIPPLAQPDMQNGRAAYGVTASSSHDEGKVLAVELRQSGMKDYLGSGWILLMEQPLDVIFAPISEIARNMALIVFVILLLQAAMLVVLGRFFLRPLGALVKGVRQVEQGRFDQKVIVRSKDEFRELADTFNAMIDKLRDTQVELVRREKLAVLGQVAGSVGHELRNPLGVMSNAVYFLQTVLSDTDETTREYLNIIKDEIAISNRIVSDLLDSVRSKPPQPEAVGVREVIERSMRQLPLPDSVSVMLEIPEALPPLRVDAMQISQVFSNLISNGVEAMPGGGVLEIRAMENRQDGTITVSVRDNGSGMTPEHLARLFEPLFTTKARGIGLGLVVVKNLTEANGGTVNVESEAGRGTVFTVTLPGNSSTPGAA
ncbi:MAG: ATP-binding protein [Desulfobulbaceae bacterium]|nr:ATP-binding protein [Desulfobulbaceae bacterium]